MSAAFAAASRAGLTAMPRRAAPAPLLRLPAAPRLALGSIRGPAICAGPGAVPSTALPSVPPCLVATPEALSRRGAWPCLAVQRHFAAGAGQRTHYEVLGVPRTATQQEIKLAYLQEAKKCHPDLNPTPDATRRFQALAEAYNVLGKPESRARYDAGPSPFEQATGSGARRTGPATPPPPSQHEPVDAESLFRSVFEELGADHLVNYVKGVQSDASEAAQKAREGDMQPTKDFMWKHKGLAAMVVLPLFAVLRFPSLVAMALRVVSLGGVVLMQAILRDPRLQMLLGRFAWHKWRMVRARAAAHTREKAKR